MKSLLSLFTIALCLCFSTGALAAGNLIDAKRAGLVGEREDGTIAAVLPNPSPDLQALVNSTNSGRLQVYRDTAVKQNIPLDEVRKIAAQKIYEMANPGEYLMINGQWSQKK